MDQNINTLIEQSRKYQYQKTTFFKNKQVHYLSPNRGYVQTEQLNTKQSRDVIPFKSKMSTFLLSLANQNLDALPSLRCIYSSIQIIDLQNNRFRVFPKELYALCNAMSLNLNSNFLKQLPNEVYLQFPKLTSFQISNNLITEVSLQIANWPLHTLDVSKNRLIRLNPLAHLTGLRTLLLQSNEFQLIPCELNSLQGLTEVGLDWFKYTSPPMNVVQTKLAVIQKLLYQLHQVQLKEYEDPSEINFSDEEIAADAGINFQQFLQYFSEHQMLANPQQGCSEQQHTIIHKAAREQDIGALLSLISEYPEMINQEDQRQATALGLAIQEEKYFSAKTLLYNGASVRKGVTAHGSILNLAIVKGQIHLIQDILYQEADPMVADKHGNTTLHYLMACFDKDVKVYKQAFQGVMKKENVDPNALNKDGWAPIHIAIKKGSVDAVKYIILHNNRDHKKFNLNLKGGRKRQSPLHLACQNCNYEITLALLQTGDMKLFAHSGANLRASQLCQHNFRMYKLMQRFEREQTYGLIVKNRGVQEQDEYSVKEQDSYTDLEESHSYFQQFDGLQLKMFKLNRSVLGYRDKATASRGRNLSQPNFGH